MTEIEELLVAEHCKRLMVRYCLALDTWDLDAFLAVFSPDAVWTRTNAPAWELEGHEGIKKGFEARPKGFPNRHLLQNAYVEVLGPDEATGFCIALVVDGGPVAEGETPQWPVPMRGVELVCEYRDRFRRFPDGWRIVRREMTRIIDKKSGTELKIA